MTGSLGRWIAVFGRFLPPCLVVSIGVFFSTHLPVGSSIFFFLSSISTNLIFYLLLFTPVLLDC